MLRGNMSKFKEKKQYTDILLTIPKTELRLVAVAGGGVCCQCVVSQTMF